MTKIIEYVCEKVDNTEVKGETFGKLFSQGC